MLLTKLQTMNKRVASQAAVQEMVSKEQARRDTIQAAGPLAVRPPLTLWYSTAVVSGHNNHTCSQPKSQGWETCNLLIG